MIIEAEWTWTGDGFARDYQVVVGTDGRIEQIGQLGLEADHPLPAQALLPGFVNAHSHAFQRGLRGWGERFPVGVGDFWSWREAMYQLVLEIDSTKLFHLTAQAFREMRASGITSVGEFHYLHHTKNATDYAYDEIILNAAAAAGIRIVLLNTYYRHGGINQPLNETQRRFESPSLEHYWQQMDALGSLLDARTQSLGAVAHSIRAVAPEEIQLLHAEALRRGIPFHMHIEEQQREVSECVEAYGARPMRLLLDRLEIGPSFTSVHSTHTSAEDMTPFLQTGANVCVTPLTEANLGDGIPAIDPLRNHLEQLSLGTDSNARISMLEEMRWLEYTQRLTEESRGLYRNSEGNVAKALMEMATRGGARSLALQAGRIYPGYWADFVAVDLNAPSLEGCDPALILDAMVFGCSEEVITATAVAGRWLQHREPRR